jgi:SAM-dependent methyltransferase
MTETFNIALEQAEAYEQRFVPALFAQLAPWMVDQIDLRPGQPVLDVACGTGIVARTVAERVGPGSVTGVDRNEAMLTVAGRLRPDIDWRHGDVAALPFEDGTFAVVLCQSALMFFPDATAALAEMARWRRRVGQSVCRCSPSSGSSRSRTSSAPRSRPHLSSSGSARTSTGRS